jgi:hypothetical protein
MRVAVYDTYVKTVEGVTVHFDVLLPEEQHSLEQAIACARDYLEKEGISYLSISAEECQLCHYEEATPEHLSRIEKEGYSIIRMEDIPPFLPENPTRRQLILYLRATYPDLRFHRFGAYSDQELWRLLKERQR